MARITMALSILGILMLVAPAEGETGLFRLLPDGLSFNGEGWAVKADGQLGWVSLKIGEAEFLAATPEYGAILFKKNDRWFTRYPDRSALSHDTQTGRFGMVADGRNMIKIAPDWFKPEFELTLGANDRDDQQVFIFLSDEVALVRMGGSLDSNRTLSPIAVDRSTKQTKSQPAALIVHRSGVALRISAATPESVKTEKGKASPPAIEAGMVAGPDGTPRLALILTCKGFIANTFNVSVETAPHGANFAVSPKFDVHSADDPNRNVGGGGAANGVKNPIYGPGVALDLGFTFGWLGSEPFNGRAELEVIHALGKTHFHQWIDLKNVKPAPSDAKESAGLIRVKFDPKFHIPGVSEVSARLFDAGGRLIWTDRYRMAWDWEHYQPTIDVQPDFKAFWVDTLKQLRAQPLEPEVTRVFEDHPTFEIYKVSMNGWAGKRIWAMMYVPKNVARPMGAIVGSHPGTRGFSVNKGPDGVYGSKAPADPRFVTLTPLIRGFEPDAADIPFNDPWWGPLEDRDTYVARSWYCAMVRGIDYLATRPDLVDMKRIIARGGSQGGGLALVTAGLDHRVAYCLADCPSNCQPREIMFNYPSFGPSRGQTPPGKTDEQTAVLLSYYNPANFAAMIQCPTYVGSNIGDLTVHSMGPLAAYHNLVQLDPSQKEFYPGFSHFHGSGPGLGVKTKEILEKLGGVRE